MDIFEFELRWLAYNGLSKRFNLNRDEKTIINLVKRTNKGQLTKKLQETSPDELKKLTEETYSSFKKKFIEENKNKIIKDTKKKQFSLSDYIIRLEYELKVIKEMGYNTYFLIVQDYINRAKKNKIAVGPGRGSAAGSLLAYLIGITDIDPLEYDLLFERFLNPARVSMPDIDTDFEDVQRDRLIEYVSQKYGREKVANIGTYMTMAAKAAFKDVARIMGIPFEKANQISELITEKTIEKSIENNETLKELIENDDVLKQTFKYAKKLEGNVRQIGVHACGIIIAPKPIFEFTPVQYPPKAGSKGERDKSRIVTQYDGHYLEDIGLLKMDFLGLRNLSIIKNTIKIIKARLEKEGKKIPEIFLKYFETMGFYPPLDDKKVYETVFQKGNTSGVFQFESDGMRKRLKQLKPTNIDDIIAMVALYRPGPMEFIPTYIKRKHGEEKIEYLPEELYNILKEKYGKKVADEEKIKITKDLSPFMNVTYGIPIYQEQLMRIVQAMAGFSLGEADLLRRGVGKKIKEIIDKLKKEFVERAEKFKGYKPETATYVYEKMIEPAANYSFNKSHAACYAIIAYQTAWLKTYYPLEFHAALLRSVEENTDKLSKFIEELKLNGFKISPPHINKSFVHVAAIDNEIVIGLLAIKGIGEEVAQFIEDERIKNGPFKNFEDFLKRCKPIINKKVLEALAKAGAFDGLINRKTILNNIEKILNFVKGLEENQNNGGLFGKLIEVKLNLPQIEETIMDRLILEYEIFKTFVSSHPFDGLYSWIKSKYNFISSIKDTENFGDFKILGIVKDIRKIRKKGVWIEIEDITGTISLFLKDNFDIKKFDILAIYGYKGKSQLPNIYEIHRFKLEDLIERAKKAKKYNEEEKVFDIISRRKSANKENPKEPTIQKINTENYKDDNPIESECTKCSLITENNLDNDDLIILNIPDSVEKIKKICKIIKENPGDIKIRLGNIECLVSDKCIEEIKKICK